MNITKDFEETGMTFLEYKDKEEKILNSYRGGSITRKVMYRLLEDNRKAYNEWQEYRRGVIDVTPMWERMEQLKRDMTSVIDATPMWERMEQLKRDMTGVIDVTPVKEQLKRMEHPDRTGVTDVTSMKEQLERMDEAQKRMRARRDEIANQWAKAYVEDGKIKVRKGCAGLPLAEMTVLEARLLAAQILSLTNPKKKRP
ncbi:hypothetical protein BT638P3_00022 [Bacteroides phage BT638P3]|nr:hypothetical protein BT638P3_00022 [Bacteroides phage BT638P3]WAX09614.1 hypothetical protein BT638P4_00003 [Bacteroides phage BT638P4]